MCSVTRRVLATLALAAAVCGLTAGAGTPPSGLTTYVFQNGTASDGSAAGSYSGCAATYIASRDGGGTGKNRGGCDTLNVSSGLGTYGAQSALISFDISDLPDDAIIWRARLWLYQINPSGTNVAPQASEMLSVYRMVVPWTEGPGACAGAQNGYADSDSAGGAHAWMTTNLGTLAASVATSRAWVTWNGTIPDSVTGSSTFTGSDTLTGYPTGPVNVTTYADYAPDPIAFSQWRSGTTASRRLGWVAIDITAQVRRWHGGMNTNHGLAVMMNTSDATATIAFASDEYSYRLRRPKLIVDYVVPSSGGGAVRRVVGGRR